MGTNEKREVKVLPSLLGVIISGIGSYIIYLFLWNITVEEGGFVSFNIGTFLIAIVPIAIYSYYSFIIIYKLGFYILNKTIKISGKVDANINKNRIKDFQKDFDRVFQKHQNYLGGIEEETVNGMVSSPILLDNDEKYKYYTNIRINQNIQKASSRIITIKSLITEISSMETKINEKIQGKYKNHLDVKEFTRLIKFINKLIDNYGKYKADYNNDKKGIIIGKEGEDAVDEALKLYDHKLTNLSGIRFEVDGMSIETDNLVLSEYGIFSLEVKNLGTGGNFSLLIDKDGRWSKVNNGKEEVISNVTQQTFRHIGLSEKLFIRELSKRGFELNLDIHPLIILANEIVDIRNYSDIPIIRCSNIYNEIRKKNDKLSPEILKEIKEIALDNMLPIKKYDTIDLDNKSKIIIRETEKIEEILNDYNEVLTEILNM